MLKKAFLPLMMMASMSQAAEVVKVYNWTDYVASDTLKNFKAETKVDVVYTTFESNEELDAKLMARHSGYDVVVPSNHFMAHQIEAGVLKELDRSRLPNWKNLNPVLLKALEVNDPGNRHGFPYLWGTTGIGYNVEKVKAVLGSEAPLTSWAGLFKPENIKKLAQCGVAILDNNAELLPITLNYLGLPHHSKDPQDYQKAKAALLAISPYVTYFHNTNYIKDLETGKICVAVGFSGDMLQAQANAAKKGEVLDYVVPQEGSPLWFDMVAMPADATNEKAAYTFMNYLLRADVVAHISNELRYANGNEKADALLDPSLITDKDYYPDADVMSRLFPLESMPADIAQLRIRIWNEVKAGH